MYLIVGLGNPGSEYAGTRHNIGFMVVDELARKHKIKVNEVKYKALIGRGIISGKQVFLAKPQTFMNLSGESVLDMVEGLKVSLKDLIVVYDDMDLDTGKIRIRPKGGAGTHNGMKSIIFQLQDDGFPRIRVGIGRPGEGQDAVAHVLGNFEQEEKAIIYEAVNKACEAVEMIIGIGINEAMNRFN
ncbi:MAG: peptidyl-tRNA hydrolase, family [Thermosediminibacterales bacterium]|nr:peptidyl-tRNA hydrolase, family [Thermosediminibacterales bacterium]